MYDNRLFMMPFVTEMSIIFKVIILYIELRVYGIVTSCNYDRS